MPLEPSLEKTRQMKTRLKEILSHAAVDTFEKLAFLFCFQEEDRDVLFQASATGASLSFMGPFSGKLLIMLSNQILPELAANMLGLGDEEETTSEQQQDALRELTNVLCGNLLPAIAGDRVVFNVDIPRIITDEHALKQAVEDGDVRGPNCLVKLDLENGQCDLFLFIDGQIPEDPDPEGSHD